MFWRRISIRQLNLVVYGLILVLVLVFWSDLRWAAKNLPRYLRGSIGAPEERKLSFRTRRILRSNRRPERAKPLLDRALAIDPRCEAGYRLGQYHLVKGNYAEAARQLERYIGINPTRVNAYRRAARAYITLHRPEKARAILVQGRDYFRVAAKALRPRPDRTVRRKFNEKAFRVYRSCRKSAATLQEAIERLDNAKGAGR